MTHIVGFSTWQRRVLVALIALLGLGFWGWAAWMVLEMINVLRYL